MKGRVYRYVLIIGLIVVTTFTVVGLYLMDRSSQPYRALRKNLVLFANMNSEIETFDMIEYSNVSGTLRLIAQNYEIGTETISLEKSRSYNFLPSEGKFNVYNDFEEGQNTVRELSYFKEMYILSNDIDISELNLVSESVIVDGLQYWKIIITGSQVLDTLVLNRLRQEIEAYLQSKTPNAVQTISEFDPVLQGDLVYEIYISKETNKIDRFNYNMSGEFLDDKFIITTVEGEYKVEYEAQLKAGVISSKSLIEKFELNNDNEIDISIF